MEVLQSIGQFFARWLAQLETTFVEKQRYLLLVDGLKNTLIITLGALVIGVVLGVFVKPDIPIILQPYLPIMVVAALDALLGAARAYFERSFSDKVFVISFISNVVTATLLVFLGNQLGVGSQLQTAVIVVLGIRIFSNVSAIRRFIFRG